MSGKVLFYVQHLLGIGHVIRASRIARALVAAGFKVQIAYGGKPVSAIEWGEAEIVRLSPVSAGPEGFSALVDEKGAPASDTLKGERRDCLLEMLENFAPDVLLIEAYPFARRVMRFELRPLLEAAHASDNCPLVVSSIRDILQEGRKPERIAETTGLIDNYFDAVLVHGDEAFAPLAESYPDAARIAGKVRYTGLVAPEPGPGKPEETFDVIVSAGGGAVGAALFEAALDAQSDCALCDAKWLLSGGPNLDQETYRALQRRLPDNVTLRRFQSDLPTLLRHAKLSISQAGYNTMADVLSAGCRAVVVPFAEGGETEQTRRGMLLAKHGRVAVVTEAVLSGERLSSAIETALNQTPENLGLDLNGALNSARILAEQLEIHRR